MRKFCFILFCFCIVGSGRSQNLVLNWSFEDTSQCPLPETGLNFVSYMPPWFSPTHGTPDLFHACYDPLLPGSINVPYTAFGYQQAKTGVGFGGFFCYYGGVSVREYLSVRLKDSLIKNQKYCVKFYVSLRDMSSYAINKMGAFISKDSIYVDTYLYINYSPQIENTAGFLSDTINWMEVSGEYYAHGGEKFVTIGNFYDDNNTDTLKIQVLGSKFSYYFLDDISIVKCDENDTTILIIDNSNSVKIINAFTPNSDGKNDYFNIKGTNISSVHMKIINRWGQLLFEATSENPGWDGTYKGQEVNPGVYYYVIEVTFKDGEVREKAGSVHLIK